jgi:hypothetical protein
MLTRVIVTGSTGRSPAPVFTLAMLSMVSDGSHSPNAV